MPTHMKATRHQVTILPVLIGIRSIQPEKSGSQAGDLYVTVQVQVPKDLTEAEMKKLREFENMYRTRTGTGAGGKNGYGGRNAG